MNTRALQQLKMAWIAAREAGDTQAQVALLRDHPEAQAALIDFIAAYRTSDIPELSSESEPLLPLTLRANQTASEPLLPLTLRANQTAMERVFDTQTAASNIRELRTQRGFTMVSAARGLRLSVDVWKKIESGAIELTSLTEKQLNRLAHYFQVSAEQFGEMLNNSSPSVTLNRRQTEFAARSEQPVQKQSLREAIQKSTMTREEKHHWLE
jgi:transcriptional regulator with XRE-family HTH domain